MGARGEDVLVGALCLLLALFNAWRLWTALKKDEVPLYRTRLRKGDTSKAKFGMLVAFNVALTLVVAVIAADLLFGLGLRGR